MSQISNSNPNEWTNNDWADFWYYTIGVNVIPAAGREKVPKKGIEWKELQNKPIDEILFKHWKKHGDFEDGMAIILGRVWRRDDRIDRYLCYIDVDNRKGIDELLTINGKTLTVEQFSQKTIVEQHADNPDRLHFYFYTIGKPLRDKSSDMFKHKDGIDANEIPAFEVKPISKYISYPAPNFHKEGCQIKILGTMEPLTLRGSMVDEYQIHIDNICKKYGLIHGGSYSSSGSNNQIPIGELFKPGNPTLEGHNRHEKILRMMESYYLRNRKILPIEKIKEDFKAKFNNTDYIIPPFNNEEIEKLYKSATGFIGKHGYDYEPNYSSSSSSSQKQSEAGASNADDDPNDNNNKGKKKKNDNNDNGKKKKNEDLNEKFIVRPHHNTIYLDNLIKEYHARTVTDTEQTWIYNEEEGIYKGDGESIL